MILYTDLAADADEILRAFGAPVALAQTTAGTYDPGTGLVGEPVTMTQEGTAAVFDFGLHQSGTSFVPGTMIQAGDKQMLLSPLAADGTALAPPIPGVTVTFDSEVWTVQAVKKTAPAGSGEGVVLFELLLRK